MTDSQNDNTGLVLQMKQLARMRPLTITGGALLLAAVAITWYSSTSISSQRGILQRRLDEWSSINDIVLSYNRFRATLSGRESLAEPVAHIERIFIEAGMVDSFELISGNNGRASQTGSDIVLFSYQISSVPPDILLTALLDMEKDKSGLRVVECRLTAGDSTPPYVSGSVTIQAIMADF